MLTDEILMNRCIQLARKAMGYVAPNPMVGAVLVHDHKIISEGYHERYGEAHAEVNAIKKIHDKNLLKQCVLYVNLEPCSHFGKTPPCADLIIASGIPEVVIGSKDSNPQVGGKGIEKLEKAGVKVRFGVLEKECRELNKRFFTYHEKKRPYVILKWAQTRDGFMDIDRGKGEKGIAWITSAPTKSVVHRWRHEESAILVGRNTIANDNPRLTCRESSGTNPVRVVIDQDLRLDYNAFLVGQADAKTIILTQKKVIGNSTLEFIQPDDFSIESILKKLAELNISSVIVEGGRDTLDRFIESGIWDEARVITGNKLFVTGVQAPLINGKKTGAFVFGNDHIQYIENA